MALKTIDLTKTDDQLTALIHGDTGAGKTAYAATFPRPLFLSPEDEKGWETLKYLPKHRLYDPNVLPMQWSLSEPKDFIEAFNRLKPLVEQKKVQTVVVDSLSFYADMFYNAITAGNTSQSDGWKAYGLLNDHLRRIRIELHKLDCHVLWLCQTRQPDDSTKSAGPNLKGQQAIAFPAGCKYVWYMQAVHEGKGKVRHELRTKKCGNAVARGRDGGRLPDPIINPTYRDIVYYLSQIPPDDFDDRPEEEIAAEMEAADESAASDDSGAQEAAAVTAAVATAGAKPAASSTAKPSATSLPPTLTTKQPTAAPSATAQPSSTAIRRPSNTGR